MGVKKLKFKYWLIAFLSAVFLAAAICAVAPKITASADTGNITCSTVSGNYLNEDYLSVYKVPTNMMTYETNGGEADGRPVSNVFDGNWNSSWVSGRDNVDTNNLIAITVTFSQPVTVQSILYATSGEGNDGCKGYPTTLGIYTANGGELSLYGTCTGTATNGRVVFALGEATTVTQVKFEFRVVTSWHKWQATAKEIQFLQPDNPDANKVLDLFEDYAQYSVKDKYKSSLSEIRQSVSNLISYESALKPLLDRADAIMDGHLKKDIRREFSTDKNAENVITQYGNMRSYASNTLKMSQFGINRQVTGFAGLTGQTIIVYVDAKAGDPLPSIVCTQAFSNWANWQYTYSLSLGKNVITFPDLINSGYSYVPVAGGPIHIVNTYEPSQQSSDVKLYIEGGYSYPVFRKGGDENSFRDELTSYYNKMNAEGLNDVVELVGDHFVHTATASRAYSDFINRNVSPQRNAVSWDNYIRAFLKFDGVAMDPSEEYFNEKNLHLYTNFRKVQPWGGAGAYSAYDHIGFVSFGEDAMTSFGTPGWGVAHEIGHALDCSPREIGETTNNMWAKFEQAYFSNGVWRNQNDWVTNNLTPDETAVDFGLFNRNRECYQIWWNVETYFPGYWGRLDNNYRYYNEAAALSAAGVVQAQDGALTRDERMVYFSSLATGIDLGYYFERCGFSFDSNTAFKLDEATNAYKKLVQKAIADGVLEDKKLKLWYLDANQYFYDVSESGCYTPSSTVEIVSANKTSSGYTLYLPTPTDPNAHLGYEIMEYRNGNWYVIGFTHARSFTDTTAYEEGYVPQYKIRAYDRSMSASAESAAVSYEELKQVNVCRIGEIYYNSLSEAVAAATAGATIYVCANLYDVAMTVNKNLTILPDTSVTGSVTITKSAAGALITVNGATLTLGSNDGAKIILDGNSFSQNGALIKVANSSARLNAYNAELRNNYNTDHGGAIYNEGGTTLTNVTIKNNVTSINGGAIANFNGGVITLTDCLLSGNRANGNGGAITIDGRTALIGTTVTGNHAGNVGGAMFISPSKNPDSRYVSVEGCEISGNTAGGNGSAFHLDKGIFTFVDSEVQISGGIYKNQGTTIRINTEALDLSDVTFQSSSVAEGTVLLTANGNFEFTEEFASGVKVMSAVAYLSGDSRTILIKPNTANVTFIVNGNAVTQVVILGDFVLPETAEGIGEDKYIAVWKSNGNSYSAGETVKITGECTFTAEIGTKCIVTLKYDDDTVKTFYIIPGTKFYLPVDSESEQYKIAGWTVGENWYAPAAGVTVTGDTEIVADIVKLFKVTLTENDTQTVSWHEYSSSIILQECTAPEGKEFSHWDVNGVEYQPGDAVYLTGDTVINAVFKEIADGNNDGSGNPSNAWVAILIIVVVLLVVAGIGVAVIIVIKRKNSATEDEE